jgi:hypothetical protein
MNWEPIILVTLVIGAGAVALHGMLGGRRKLTILTREEVYYSVPTTWGSALEIAIFIDHKRKDGSVANINEVTKFLESLEEDGSIDSKLDSDRYEPPRKVWRNLF